MNVDAHDLIVLHKNVNRLVGKEIFWNNSLANNDREIMQSIENLIENKLLMQTNKFEFSIPKINNDELREVLKEHNLKIGGNKTELISRIYDNLENITSLELPYVYIATENGEKILNDTEYLLSFDVEPNGFGVSINRAYYLAENCVSEHCNDKVVEIYKFEFQRDYENEEIQSDGLHKLDRLISHYNFNVKDYDNARKYLNILYYFRLKYFLKEITESMYSWYYDDEGNLQIDRIKNVISTRFEGIYEKLMFSRNLSNESIFKLFKDDTKAYNDLEDEVTEKYINYIIAVVKKENETKAASEFEKVLTSNYALDKEEFEEEYDYRSNFITTDISSLKDMNPEIEVEIDISNGKINFFLDDDSLDTLIKKSE